MVVYSRQTGFWVGKGTLLDIAWPQSGDFLRYGPVVAPGDVDNMKKLCQGLNQLIEAMHCPECNQPFQLADFKKWEGVCFNCQAWMNFKPINQQRKG